MFRQHKALFILFLLTFFLQFVYPAINTRLHYISNTHNSPSPGKGTLVVDVEAMSDDGNSYPMSSFQNALQLDSQFQSQNPVVTFSNQLFPSPDYTTTEDYNNTTKPGRIRFVYTFDSGTQGVISTNWTRIVTITIVYDMGGSSGSISWYNDIPEYFCTDNSNSQNQESEEAIPPELNDISLPVELSSFTITPGNHTATLQWNTASEVNNSGFEIYRATEKEGNYVMVASYQNTPSLKGTVNPSQGHHYLYTDRNLVNGQTYWYKLADVDFNGHINFHETVSVIPNTSGAQLQRQELLPNSFQLHQNYPNPFNPTTTIQFDIPASSPKMVQVQLTIFNPLGKKIRTLYQGSLQPGSYTLVWDGRDDAGNAVASGLYFYSIRTDNFLFAAKKMMLLK